jgi:DNA polymerase (family 10)
MPIRNTDIADIFNRMANLLEIDGANPFRVRAYRNAARTAAGLGRELADMVAGQEDLSRLPGIGKDLAGKIEEIVHTGALRQLQALEARVPPGLNDLLRVPGLGPRRVQALYRNLGVSNLAQLEAAVRQNRIREVDGFGKKTEQSIRESLARIEKRRERFPLPEAEQRAADLVAHLRAGRGIRRITVAGSYRRRQETVGDLDVLVVCGRDADVMDRLVRYGEVDKIVSRGSTRSSVILKCGLQVDLRVVPASAYGAGLHYFTGSKAHVVALRRMGVARGLKINEYGVYRGNRRVAGKTEAEVYAQLDLPCIPPELRENEGEIEAAQAHCLPTLVELDDIRGDLHSHTRWSDGHDDLEAMAKAARDRGYAYLAVTDHSRRVAMANGLDAKRLAAQIERIDRLNENLGSFRLLKAIEVDILEDGTLDLPDAILKDLDLRVCAIHYGLDLPRERQTRRILKAMENPYFNILAHPTGRLIGQRRGSDIDMERIMAAARQAGCILELNADPRRLDLTDAHCRMAKERGVKVAVSTDAHSTDGLGFMRFGIGQARRGWLEAQDVVNTRGRDALLKSMRRS